MDSNPCSQNSKFVELLNSQQEMVFGFSQDSVSLSSSQAPVFAFQATTETPAERRERRVWTPVDDVVLISS